MDENELQQDLIEKCPLCVAAGQPVCNEMIERELEQTMSINERVEAKLKAGIQPTAKEEMHCTLPYDLPGEIWKPVHNYETNYEISNYGRVKSILYDKILCARQKHGYAGLTIYKNSKQKDILVHRLVAEAFIPKTEEDIKLNRDEVNHKDGNKRNNRVENLEWCTNEENQRHSHYTGLCKHDAINRKILLEMIKLYDSGLNTSDIHRLYYPNISSSIIARAIFRSKYKWYSDIPIPAKHDIKRGSSSPLSKLSDEDVDRIRSLYAKGDITQCKLGEMFGVSSSCIRHVINRSSYI